MNKKLIFIPLVILAVSFSAGIFTEIVISHKVSQLPVLLPSVTTSLLSYIKNDAITTLAALIFSASVFLVPLVPLMVIGKTFSLGFSAAYILSSSAEKAFGILITALLPRGMFKLPTYIVLLFISLEAAAFVKKNYQNPSALKHGAPKHLLRFLFCFLALVISSVLEVFLLQGVL